MLLSGELYQKVMPEDTVWNLEDGVLHVELIKFNNTKKGTISVVHLGFWRGLMALGPFLETEQPPADYFKTK